MLRGNRVVLELKKMLLIAESSDTAILQPCNRVMRKKRKPRWQHYSARTSGSYMILPSGIPLQEYLCRVRLSHTVPMKSSPLFRTSVLLSPKDVLHSVRCKTCTSPSREACEKKCRWNCSPRPTCIPTLEPTSCCPTTTLGGQHRLSNATCQRQANHTSSSKACR